MISVRNPVHSVLFLILAFFNAAGLFILLGAEFLAMILVVVYVGAVAVLFLFVVMMLDINFTELKSGFLRYLPIGSFVGLVLLVELILVFWGFGKGDFPVSGSSGILLSGGSSGVTNTALIGNVLYTDYVYFFQLGGIILLVAMIGAIVLTLRHKSGVKRQSVYVQTTRSVEESIDLYPIKPGDL